MRPQDITLSANIQVLDENDKPLLCYDDGRGPLWVLSDSMGITGVIRAASFETAYEIAEDEFFSEADLNYEAIAKECGCTLDDLIDNPIFQESYGFRPNGPNERDIMGHGIYEKDLNGDSLLELTPKRLKSLHLTVIIA